MIPARRQKQIMEISGRFAAEGKIKRALVPDDFYSVKSDLSGEAAKPAA